MSSSKIRKGQAGEEPRKPSKFAASPPAEGQEKSDGPKPLGFSVVGIGASAGGLEAIETFFRHMPPDSGMSFVVIQHLSPDHQSILAEIIQRDTTMPVRQVEDGMPVERDSIYVIPPGRDMVISKGILKLEPPQKTDSVRLPIDRFFRSLAEDQMEKAICILLSGAGSDGTMSLKTVKAMGGITIAQDGGAKFKDMPQSAISSGMVDFILLAEEMPAKLQELVRDRPVLPEREQPPAVDVPDSDGQLMRILQIVRLRTGHDFSRYKYSTIRRRIERRMVLHHLGTLGQYTEFLEKSEDEPKALFGELLIGVTHFFRDAEAFEVLAREVIPTICKGKSEADSVRIWIPGCSTGEEAYTLAILLAEHLETLHGAVRVQIFCTDIDSDALEIARRGIYPDNIAVDVSPERLSRYFEREGKKSYRVVKEIRDMVVIAPHSVIKDPPFSRLDLISCRNLLIYLGVDIQKKLIPLFHYSLNPDGFLFIGPSESLGEYARNFAVVDGKWKLFQRKGDLTETIPGLTIFPAERASFLKTGYLSEPQPGPVAMVTRAERQLLEEYAPASVIVNDRYDILHLYGKLEHFLALTGGEPTRSVLKLAREDIRLDLRAAIHAAAKERSLVKRTGLSVRVNGNTSRYTLTVKPVVGPAPDELVLLVVFQEIAQTEPVLQEPRPEIPMTDLSVAKSLEEELTSTREKLQASIEEMEASNEELKSSNEELTSMNEELQSSNEELETSREELQSLNEELRTVNQELQFKIDELSRVNSDLQNLLNATKIATLFLDKSMTIKRFTPQITEFFSLLDLDVGRSIADIAQRIDSMAMMDDIQSVIDTLIPCEREVRTKEGKWFIMRIAPYRTVENKIEGTVVTFVDVTGLKEAQQSLLAKTTEIEALLRAIPDTYLRLGKDMTIHDFKDGAAGLFGQPEQSVGLHLGKALPLEAVSAIDAAAKEMAESGSLASADFTLKVTGEDRHFEARLVPVLGDQLLALLRDMTKLRGAEKQAMQASQAKSDFLANMSHEIRTPLNGIVGLTEMALREAEGKTKEHLLDVQESARTLMSIVNDILNIAKIESGHFTLAQAPFDLYKTVERALQPLRLAAGYKGLRLYSEIEPDVPARLVGDEIRLGQILTNLVGNAIKFTQRGEIAVKVDAVPCPAEKDARTHACLRFTVRDTGIGIARDVQQTIFEKFVQAEISSVKEFAGTGLGLPISKTLIEMMGGDIQVESKRGRGSTFLFTVVLGRQEKAQKAGKKEPREASSSVPPWKKPLDILLAEDNAISRRLVEELLRQGGHQVVSVTNGAAALEALGAKSFDVAILDISMPKLDGLELTRLIRSSQAQGVDPKLPIIALTAHAFDSDRERILQAGVDAYVAKPIQFDKFYEALSQVARKPKQ